MGIRMIDRYTLPRMKTIWATEHKLETWLRIERLVCEALAQQGEIPKSALPDIRKKVKIDVQRMEEIEAVVKHDVIAFLEMISEQIGPQARYLHQGLTSSDILDTSLSVLMVEAADLIIEGLERLRKVLKQRAFEFKETVMVGRSHGVHGEPITFGLKLTLWYAETERNLERMRRSREEVRYGKLSGAMGTFAHLPPSVEEYVCQRLGLKPAPISSQIRHLQRTEVLEVEEYFSEGQKGSSAMPHKRNPIAAENLSGLTRVVRANALAATENIPLWHERDISHSSAERIIIPDSTCLVDYMLSRFTEIIKTLIVYPERMKGNLKRTEGLIYSQRILLELIKRGVARDQAYQVVQHHALAAWQDQGKFADLIKSDPVIRKYLTPKIIKDCFEVKYYLKHLETIYKRVFL